MDHLFLFLVLSVFSVHILNVIIKYIQILSFKIYHYEWSSYSRISSTRILLTNIIKSKEYDFKNHFDNLCLLIGAFNPFTFSAINDLFQFKSTIYL